MGEKTIKISLKFLCVLLALQVFNISLYINTPLSGAANNASINSINSYLELITEINFCDQDPVSDKESSAPNIQIVEIIDLYYNSHFHYEYSGLTFFNFAKISFYQFVVKDFILGISTPPPLPTIHF